LTATPVKKGAKGERRKGCVFDDEYVGDILQIPVDEFDPRVRKGAVGGGRGSPNVHITWPFDGRLYEGL